MTGSMSQEEIDALLAGGAAADADAEPATADAGEAPAATPGGLGPDQREAIGEVGDICMSRAAPALGQLLGHEVTISAPEVDLADADAVRADIGLPAAVATVEFSQGLGGRNLLVLGSGEAAVIAALMMGSPPAEPGDSVEALDDRRLSALSEAMNQIMASAATAMAEMIGTGVEVSAPRLRVIGADDDDGLDLPDAQALVRVRFSLKVGELIDTALIHLMPLEFARALVEGLVAGSSAAASDVTTAPAPDPGDAQAPAAAAANPAPGRPGPTAPLAAVPPPVVQPVTFPSLDDAVVAPPAGDIALLMDVPLQVTVELGRTRMRIREVLDLAPGSIIELERLAGEPVDVLVNGKQIARGEVVVINEEFGVRITEVAHPATRLRGVAAEG